MSMTFGELIKNQMQDPSNDVVKAAEYVIQFGKHKGMNLSMLLEEQHGYCLWLLKQDESQNLKFNDTVHHLKILIAASNEMSIDHGVIDLGAENKLKVDGVGAGAGEKAILHIDPAKEDPTKIKPVVGLLMGTVTDLMNQVDEGLTFDFSSEDIDVWLGLVSQVELGVNQFVIIETQFKFQGQQNHAQKITMVVSDLKKLKGVF